MKCIGASFCRAQAPLTRSGDEKAQINQDSQDDAPFSGACPRADCPFVIYLASHEAAVVTGEVFQIDSGYTAFKANVDLMGAARGQI
jgi:hypothetical protein